MPDETAPLSPAPPAAAASEATAPPPRRRRWLRRTAYVLVALTLLVAFAPFALSIAPVRRFVAEKASERLGRRVTIGGITARWWSGIELRDLEVHNPDGFSGPPLLAVDRVELHVAVLRALAGEIRASATVENPVVTLERLADGRRNSDGLEPARAPKRPKEPREPSEDEGSARGPKAPKTMPSVVFALRGGRVVSLDATAAPGGAARAPDEIDGITVDATTKPDGSVKASFAAVARRAGPGGRDAEVRASVDWDGERSGPASLSVPSIDLARLSSVLGAALGLDALSGSVEATAAVTTDAQGRPTGEARAALSSLEARRAGTSVSVGSASLDVRPTADGDATRLALDVVVRALRVSGLSAKGAGLDEPELRLSGDVLRARNGDLSFGTAAAPLALVGRTASGTVSGSLKGLSGEAAEADLRARLSVVLSPALGRLAGLLGSPDDDLRGTATLDATVAGKAGALAVTVDGGVRDLVVGGAAGTEPFREPSVALGLTATWDAKAKTLTLSRALLAAGALTARLEPPFLVRLGGEKGAEGVLTVDADLARLAGLRAMVPSLASLRSGQVHVEAKARVEGGARGDYSVEGRGLAFAPGSLSAAGYEEPRVILKGSFERPDGKPTVVRVTTLSSAMLSLLDREGPLEVRLEDAGPAVGGSAVLALDLAAASRAFGKAMGLAPGETMAGRLELRGSGTSSAAGSAFDLKVSGRDVALPRGGAPAGRVEASAHVVRDARTRGVAVTGIDVAAFGFHVTGEATLSKGPAGMEPASAHVEARGDLVEARPLLALAAGLPAGATLSGTVESRVDLRADGASRVVTGRTTVSRLHWQSSARASPVDEASVVLEHDVTLSTAEASSDVVRLDKVTLASAALSASAAGTVTRRAGGVDLHVRAALDGDAAVLAGHLKGLLGKGYEDTAGEGRVKGTVSLDGPTANDGRDLLVDANLSFKKFASAGLTAQDGRLSVRRARAAAPVEGSLTSGVNGGTLSASGTCDLGVGESPWTAKVAVKGLDTSPLVSGRGVGKLLPMVLPALIKGGGSTPVLSGALDADLDFKAASIREPLSLDSLSGPGSLRMGQGQLSESRLFAALSGDGGGKGISNLLKLVPGAGKAFAQLGRSLLFSELSSRFELGGRRVHLIEVKMTSEAAALRFDGYVGFDGRLDLHVPLELRGETGKLVKPFVADKTIPLHVTGTAHEPTVKPELKLEDAGKGLIDDLLKGKKPR